MKNALLLLALTALTVAACGGEEATVPTAPPGAPDQLLSGTLAGLTAANAVDEAGNRITGTVAGDHFSLSLPAGHLYRIEVGTVAEGRVVFPRSAGFDGVIRVRAGVAAWDLGVLVPARLVQGLEEDGAGGSGGTGADDPGEVEDDHDSCHDGLDASTGAACTDDDDGEECEDEDDDAELSCDESCAGSELYEPSNVPPTSFGDCTEDEDDDEGEDDSHAGEAGTGGEGAEDHDGAP